VTSLRGPSWGRRDEWAEFGPPTPPGMRTRTIIGALTTGAAAGVGITYLLITILGGHP
jgi:hypothetical protein